MNPWRWEIVGDMVVLGSLAAYAASLGGRISAGDLTTAESSVITQLLVVLGLILGFGFQQVGLWQARRETREQRRKDAEERERLRAEDKAEQIQRAKEVADLLAAQTELIALRAQSRHEETMTHLDDVKDTATLAFETANHSNEKIARLAEHLDSSLQIVPAVAAAVADVLKPAPVAPSIDRTPGTVLTEMRPPVEEASDGHISE